MFFFLLVIVLGLESWNRLSDVNDSSAQIRDRWLPSTRALGDLNNFTTDFPAAAAALLRAKHDGERTAIDIQMAGLDRAIEAAQHAYLQIPHDRIEDDLYRRFEAGWSEYRATVARVRSLSSSEESASVMRVRETAVYGASLKSAYEAASTPLSMLTDRNVASARQASERSDIAYAQARKRIAYTILLAGLLVAGAMLHVSRSISAPLVDLAARMHRLAASETTVEVIGTQRRDEIGEMARAVVVFRNNAIDLAKNRQALAQQASMLQEKLAEEQRLTLMQRNFVSMASHEFRTPLSLIDGHAQRLISMRDRLTNGELVERVRKIRNAVHRMMQLIDNLIGSARLIDGRIKLNCHPTRVDLTALVSEVCRLQREMTPHAHVVDRIEPRPLIVFGDASLLRQCVGNLLSNAVKYSPDGGLVQVTVKREGRQIAVLVEDHGIGIPEKDRQRVFESYYRGSNTSGIVGSGVGLYLVKAIVDLHAGTIALQSIEGEGSRFTLRLPTRAGDGSNPRGPVGETSIRGPPELADTG